MKIRRVLHIIGSNKGGAAVVLDQIARKLDRRRYAPSVVFEVQKQSIVGKKLTDLGIKVFALRKDYSENVSTFTISGRRRDTGGWIEANLGRRAREAYESSRSLYRFVTKKPFTIKTILRIIKENNIDLVHSHNDLGGGKSHILAALLAGVPCISHCHRFVRLSNFDKLFCRYVDTFIFVSKQIAEDYFSQGILRAKGTIIHNGLDLNEFLQPYDSTSVREELGCRPKDRLVGIIGRLDWWKGQDYFIEAVAVASQQIPRLKGLIIGEVDHSFRNRQYYMKLQSLIELNALGKNIIFTGFRDDVPRVISALDLVVHASSEPEPFGLVVLEGMAAGKPVIATAAGGVLDIIEDGKSGLLVPPKDYKAMAKTIIQLLSHEQQAQQLGLAAYRRVAHCFTLQQQVEAIQRVYDATLNSMDQNRSQNNNNGRG